MLWYVLVFNFCYRAIFYTACLVIRAKANYLRIHCYKIVCVYDGKIMLEHFASKLRKILNVVFESLYFLEHSCLKQAIYSQGIVFIEIPLVIYFG